MKNIIYFIIASCLSLCSCTSSENYYSSGLKKSLSDDRAAIEDFNRAIESNPKFTEAYYARGNSKRVLKDYQGCIEDCNKAISLDPKHAEAYHNRGFSKITLDQFDSGYMDLIKADELGAQYARKSMEEIAKSFYDNGNLKLDQKNYIGSIEDYNKAIKLNPKHAEAYRNRGLSKIASGQKDSGCLDLRKAEELGLGVLTEINENCK
jgi:tetratricopeptide (TPR) repeat protein